MFAIIQINSTADLTVAFRTFEKSVVITKMEFKVTVKNESLKDDLFKIYRQLFPQINDIRILKFEELSKSPINSIVKVTPIRTVREINPVIFKIFDLKVNTEKFNDKNDTSNIERENCLISNRSTEFRVTIPKVMNELNKHGLCQKGSYFY